MKYNNTPEQLNEIRKIMKQENIKIKDLSEKLNKTQAATSGSLKMKNISLDSLKEICDAIGYDIYIEFKKKEQ